LDKNAAGGNHHARLIMIWTTSHRRGLWGMAPKLLAFLPSLKK
jgi:hypothetical protein